MKKNIFISFFILSSLTLFSQKDTSNDIFTGLRVGSGYSTFHCQKVNDNFAFKPNFYVGIYYEFAKLFFTYQFEFNFKNTGANKDVDDWSFNLNYLTLDLISKKSISSKIDVNILFGTYGAILVSKKISSDNQVELNYIENGFSRYDFGLIFGLEKKVFSIKNNQIILDSRIIYGLYDFHKSKPLYISSIDSKWERNLNINIGLQIKLN